MTDPIPFRRPVRDRQEWRGEPGAFDDGAIDFPRTPGEPCQYCGAALYPDDRCTNMLCASYFIRGEPVERSPYDYTRSCAACDGPVYKSGQCIKMFCDGRAADSGRTS